MDFALAQLEKQPEPLQILVVAGRNQALLKKVQRFAAASHHQVRAWGYTDQVRTLMIASSYGDGTASSGTVKILKDLDYDIEGKNVIIIEDIIDSGTTMNYLLKYFEGRKPASVKLCALMSKPSRRKVDVKIDYCGYEVPDEFLVGYGLDYAEKYRNLPYIGVLKKEIYAE